MSELTGRFLTWARNRLKEPESRAAVAAAFGTLSAYFGGKMDAETTLIALATAVVAFVVPRPKSSGPVVPAQ